MFLKYYLIFIIFYFANVKCKELQYTDLVENFKISNLLHGLAKYSTSNCSEDLSAYLKGIRTGQSWALTMFDSSAKIPDGILYGNSKFLGHFDECLSVEVPDYGFFGQHCLLGTAVTLPGNPTSVKFVTPFQVRAASGTTLQLYFGLCLPSTCTAIEIETSLNTLFNKTSLGDSINVKLDAENCWTNEPRELEDSDWATVGVLIAFGVVALASTVYDIFTQYGQKNGKPHPLLASFSMYTNIEQLFKISEASIQLKSLHGFRVLSMCWVVLGHSFAATSSGPIVNGLDVLKIMKDVNYVLIFNAYVAVDSFFFLSGLLVCFVFFRDIGKKRYYDFPLGYIHRYIRLTPPLAMMILIQATIYGYFGNGPLWDSFKILSTDCRENWWSELLYILNFATPKSVCLGQSWYLSTDMQLYWLSPLLLYPLLLWPIFSPIYLVLLILATLFTDFAIAYVNDLGASILFTHSENQYELEYIQFYTRAAPWLIGVAVGYLICGIQAKKIKIQLSKLWIVIGWLTSTGLCLGALYGITAFTDGEWTTLEASFYLPFHRLAWSIGLAWIVFACTQGYGGPVNTFLSWNVFQPLGKLSYNVFIIHMSIQMYRISVMRTNSYAGNLEMTYYYLGDLVLANLLAIPFTLLFEMPFGNIDRYFFQTVKILPLPKPKKVYETKEGRNDNDNAPDVENRADSASIQKDETQFTRS